MKNIKINDIEYEIVKNYREGFVQEEVLVRFTDDFLKFDYIFGDWAYGKLRIKGFYDSDNKDVKNFNNIIFLDKHIEENCAVDCRHFLLKKKN